MSVNSNKVELNGCNPLLVTRFDRIGKEVIYDNLGGTADTVRPNKETDYYYMLN